MTRINMTVNSLYRTINVNVTQNNTVFINWMKNTSDNLNTKSFTSSLFKLVLTNRFKQS